MIVGCPKEIKTLECRVGLTPSGTKLLVKDGNKVLIEKGAGLGSGYSDEEYKKSGAELVDKAEDLYKRSQIIVKVKEPLESEYRFFRSGLIIFTYFHLASDKALTEALLKKKVTALAYETYVDENETVPMLDCMSEVAGKLSIIEGANCLFSRNGGLGLLLPKLGNLPATKVTVIGAGHAGISAAELAEKMGCEVSLLDIDKKRLQNLSSAFPTMKILFSSSENILHEISKADLVILAALVRGGKAPILIHRGDLKMMKKGSVIVDVAIDQGGCAETSHSTTHQNPTFVVDGIIHYCVSNMPGIVARTSTIALTETTISHLRKLAKVGLIELLSEEPRYISLVNTYEGSLTNEGVGRALSLPISPLQIN